MDEENEIINRSKISTFFLTIILSLIHFFITLADKGRFDVYIILNLIVLVPLIILMTIILFKNEGTEENEKFLAIPLGFLLIISIILCIFSYITTRTNDFLGIYIFTSITKSLSTVGFFILNFE